MDARLSGLSAWCTSRIQLDRPAHLYLPVVPHTWENHKAALLQYMGFYVLFKGISPHSPDVGLECVSGRRGGGIRCCRGQEKGGEARWI